MPMRVLASAPARQAWATVGQSRWLLPKIYWKRGSKKSPSKNFIFETPLVFLHAFAYSISQGITLFFITEHVKFFSSIHIGSLFLCSFESEAMVLKIPAALAYFLGCARTYLRQYVANRNALAGKHGFCEVCGQPANHYLYETKSPLCSKACLVSTRCKDRFIFCLKRALLVSHHPAVACKYYVCAL